MRAILAVLLVAMLTGCGHIKQWRESRKEKSDTTTVTTTTTNATTTTTVTEKADTTVKIKGDSAVIVKPIENLINGGVIEAVNNETSVKVTYDPATGNIRAVGRTIERNVPIKIDRKTETTGQTVSRTDSKSSSSSKEVVRVSRKDKEPSKGKFWWGFLFAVFLLLILVILFLVGRGYLRRWIPPKI